MKPTNGSDKVFFGIFPTLTKFDCNYNTNWANMKTSSELVWQTEKGGGNK